MDTGLEKCPTSPPLPRTAELTGCWDLTPAVELDLCIRQIDALGGHREGVTFRDRDRSPRRACLAGAHRLRHLPRVEPFHTSSKRASRGRRAPRGTHAALRQQGDDLSPHRDEGRTKSRTTLAWTPAG